MGNESAVKIEAQQLDLRRHPINLGIDFRHATRRLEARADYERKSTMKSAYELAMERLEKTSPSISLTDEQKNEIAEVDSVYRAKIAEREVFLRDQIRKAQIAGNLEEVQSLEKQLASEMRRLQEECEAKKEKLRRGFAKQV
jgi:hypothetical protein